MVDVWFTNAISNYGPNQHEWSCVSLLSVSAKTRSEVQRHVKFIVELVSEGARNALNTLQTFAEGDQAAPQNANLQTTSGFRQGAMSIFTTIISAGWLLNIKPKYPSTSAKISKYFVRENGSKVGNLLEYLTTTAMPPLVSDSLALAKLALSASLAILALSITMALMIEMATLAKTISTITLAAKQSNVVWCNY